MSCGGTIVKLVLTALNFVLLAVSSFVIYLGVQTMNLEKDADIKTLINTNLQTGSLVVIGLGATLFIICAIGFIGACCESSCMLNFYGLLMFIMLVGNVALLLTGYRYKDEVEKRFSTGLENAINKFQDDKTIALGLQKFQSTLECCGWKGPSDYASSEVPSSCCGQPVTVKESTKTCSRSSIVYQTGCLNSPVVSKYLGHILYSTVALFLLQLIIILAACCLARDIRSVPSDWD